MSVIQVSVVIVSSVVASVLVSLLFYKRSDDKLKRYKEDVDNSLNVYLENIKECTGTMKRTLEEMRSYYRRKENKDGE